MKKIIFVFASIMVVTATLLPAGIALAYQDNDALSIQMQQGRTQLYALGACLDNQVLKSSVSAEDLNKFKIWDTDGTKGVGHEIQANKGELACDALDYKALLAFIDMTPEQFRDMIYVDPDNNGKYGLRMTADDIDKFLQE